MALKKMPPPAGAVTVTVTYLQAGKGAATCFLYSKDGKSYDQIPAAASPPPSQDVFQVAADGTVLAGRLLFVRAYVTPVKIPDAARATSELNQPNTTLAESELVTNPDEAAELRFAYKFDG
jgi:hypothetical protein